MGNQILGRRGRNFYKGFNDNQLEYLKEKFEAISDKGNLNKAQFMKSYYVNENLTNSFFKEIDFD